MKRALVLILALAACVDDTNDRGGKNLDKAARADCLAQGGRVGFGGLVPDEVCFRPTRDAGKACTRASDCEGLCLADTRSCSAEGPMFGCFSFLDENGQAQDICVD